MKQIAAWSEYCKSLTPAILEACAAAPVASGPGGLLKELGRTLPDWHFRHVFCRGGWYRLGGVLKTDGSRVAENLERWAEDALKERDGDMGLLAEDFAGAGLLATRLVGRTHFLVAQAGDGPADFLQLEVEDLQEVLSHQLFEGAPVPSSLEELVDPRAHAASGHPISMPRYAMRRLIHVGALVGRMQAPRPDPVPLQRMLDDWEASSAGATSAFQNHWVVAVREFLDRYKQSQIHGQAVAAFSGDVPEFNATAGTNGLALNEALVGFDRAVGYPMAWFFHMVTGKTVPHWVGQAVVEDALAGFAYLPERDVNVVRGWLHWPY